MTSIESLETSFREWWAAQGYAAKPNPHTVTIASAWASTLLPPEPATADGPAVPEGREPASVAQQPTSPPDWRGLCEKLLRGLDENRHPEVRYPGDLRLVMASAREAFAQPEPEAVGPGDWRGVCELVDDLREQADQGYCEFVSRIDLRRAADVLEQLAVSAHKQEPAVGPPSDDELLELAQHYSVSYTMSDGSVVYPLQYGCDMRDDVLSFARAVLARWGRPAPAPAGDVMGPTYDDLSELCSEHGLNVDSWSLEKFDALWEVSRAVLARWGSPNLAELRRSLGDPVERQAAPVPVAISERLPGPEDCESHGWCWVLYRGYSTWALEPPCGQDGMPTGWTHWLPAHALPLPSGEVEA